MKRRKAREYALQFLYGIDFIGKSCTIESKEIRDKLILFWTEAEEKDAEIISFSEDIIIGTINNLKKIDAIIQSAAEKWKMFRMAAIDRNILRFATFELLFKKDIPAAVTINEAIEIAKSYSTVDSASFINGILDRIAKDSSEGKKASHPHKKTSPVESM